MLSNTGDLAHTLNLKRTGTGRYSGACPACGYPTGFTLNEGGGRLLVYCHAGGCSFEDIRPYLWADTNALPMKRLEPDTSLKLETNAKVRETIQRLWHEAKLIQGTLAERYLNHRAITLCSSSLRFHPALWCVEAGKPLPAMLGGVTVVDSPDAVVALHRTWLKADGSGKADLIAPKKILGHVKGHGVHFGHPTDELAISEGIETALSVQQAMGIPTWAALSAGNFLSLNLPEHVKTLWLFADRDTHGVGQQKALEAVNHWNRQGRTVRLVLPENNDTDFNDILRGETA